MAAADATHDGPSAGHQHSDAHAPEAATDHDAHGQEALGPVDWAAWGAGILGAAAAAIIAVALYLAANPST